MAADRAIVQRVIKETLDVVEKNAPMSYAVLNSDPAKFYALSQAISDAASEEVHIAREIRDGRSTDMNERLARCLSEDRMEMIREGLNIPTFQMDIRKNEKGNYEVKITTEGKWFLASRELETTVDIEWATILQYASIVVEAILLVLSVVGIALSPSEKATEAAADDAAQVMKTSSKLQQAMEKFTAAWKKAGSSSINKAKALFFLIKESYAGGILWSIIKALCKNMSWYDWLETSAKVTAMVIAALATDGAALIAKIALAVISAVDFGKKIANVIKLSEIKQELESQ